MTRAEPRRERDPAVVGLVDETRHVAVYRWALLPPSETFIRTEALALRRYTPIFVGGYREPGLELPVDRVVVALPGRRLQRAIRRRLPGYDPHARLIRMCRASGVRLVHAHFGYEGLGALRLARALGVPLTVKFHGFDATMTDDALLAAGGTTAEYVQRRAELFEGATLLIGVSHFITDELRRRGAPDSKLRVHHVGVPLSAPPPGPERDPVVLFVGRHIEKKGLGDLVDAMAIVRASVPSARLVVVGDGPLRAQHEARARELGIAAEFIGWLPPDGVTAQLQRARVLCVPSRRAQNGDAEGMPTVIPEAGACGLPIVATRHSGIPEALADERGGLLADEGDVDAIARHLAAVLSDGELWRRLSEGARENIRVNFDPERQAQQLERLFDEALRRRG